MKISLSWLKRHVDLDGLSIAEIADRLTLRTAEVEEVVTVGEELKAVKTGLITQLNPHPEADRLQIATVSLEQEELNIVCGATNIQVGQKVPVATVGTRLPDGLKIKKSRIRGIESQGMLCSMKELGLGQDHEGIHILPDNTALNSSIVDVLQLSDAVIDFDNKALTHRPDLWGHRGMARELSVLFDRPLKDLATWNQPAPTQEFPLSVQVEDSAACTRYQSLVLMGVKQQASPAWMTQLLKHVDHNSHGLLVDVTNFVMLDLGQPLHAFDAAKVQGGVIQVRAANPGESLELLDGRTIELRPEDLIIADQNKPLALAGVMGGAPSGVSDDTQAVILECAHFLPMPVRKSAVFHDARSDSSNRFEKMLDPYGTTAAIQMAGQLICDHCPDTQVASTLSDHFPHPPEPRTIIYNPDRLQAKLGYEISADDQKKSLVGLGFGVEGHNDGDFQVSVPSFRAGKDVSHADDILEEIGRLIGYDNITPILPPIVSEPTYREPQLIHIRQIKRALAGSQALTEVVHRNFANDGVLQAMGEQDLPYVEVVQGSKEAKRLRRRLTSSLLQAAILNANHRESFGLFEVGKVHRPENAEGTEIEEAESEHIAALVSTPAQEQELAFQKALGHLQGLFKHLQVQAECFPLDENDALYAPFMHPGRCAVVKDSQGQVLGLLFEVHPQCLRPLGMEGSRCAVFELEEKALRAATSGGSRFQAPPKYPGLHRDIAILVPQKTSQQSVQDLLMAANVPNLKGLTLLNEYSGDQIEAGWRSLTYGLDIRSDKKTLKDKDAQRALDAVKDLVEKNSFRLR